MTILEPGGGATFTACEGLVVVSRFHRENVPLRISTGKSLCLCQAPQLKHCEEAKSRLPHRRLVSAQSCANISSFRHRWPFVRFASSPLQPPSQLILGEVERRVCKELAAHHQLERGAKTIVVDCNGQDSRNENRHFHQAANLSQIYHKAVAPGYVTPRGCPFAELKTKAHFSLPGGLYYTHRLVSCCCKLQDRFVVRL